MSDATRILDRVQQGDAKAAEELLPLVYEELHQLAKMHHNKTRLARPDMPCPLPQSSAVRGVVFRGRQRN